jgi:SpoU rRNA methylase family enzyme
MVNALRCHDFYPPQAVADKLSEKITEIYDAGIDEAVELLLNDVDFLVKDEPKEPVVIPEIVESVDIVADDVDDLLDDKLDEELGDATSIGTKNNAIKIADDETLDGDIEIDTEV